MYREFSIKGLKPVSINASYFPSQYGFTKTSKANEWSYNIFYALGSKENEQYLKELREYFDPKKHVYIVYITVFYPKSEFFTKKDEISQKTIDVTNFEKAIVDCLFLPKHFDEPAPYGCKNLNIDDKHVVNVNSKKWYKDSTGYEVCLGVEIVERESFIPQCRI